jgi:uncharacterized protein
MIATDDPVLAEILRAIVSRVNPRKIILFGSRARGDANPDSDIDLLIVEDVPVAAKQPPWERVGDLYRHLPPARPPTDLLLYSRDSVDRLQDNASHIIGRALREGTTVYERPE